MGHQWQSFTLIISAHQSETESTEARPFKSWQPYSWECLALFFTSFIQLPRYKNPSQNSPVTLNPSFPHTLAHSDNFAVAKD